MERLSGLDATFLYLETDAGHMHVAMVGIYDVSTMRDGYSFEKLKQHIAERLHVVPPFRRRLVEVPFQFHHPVWIEDPDFDLDYHVRRITCPAPGGRRACRCRCRSPPASGCAGSCAPPRRQTSAG